MTTRGYSVLGDDGPMAKISRREAEIIVAGGGFAHEDVNMIENYAKWTKDALVVETMALSHKILEMQKIQDALIEQNRVQRESIQEAEMNGKRGWWKAQMLHSRLKFMLMGKQEGDVTSSTSNGETEKLDNSRSVKEVDGTSSSSSSSESSSPTSSSTGCGDSGSSRVHDECSTCTCNSNHKKVRSDNGKFPQETMGLQLEYAVGLLVEDFQRKFKVAISDKRKEYVKAPPVGVSKIAWLKAARITLKTIGDAEEIVLHSGATAFLTRDDKLNWNPHQRFDNLLRCAKFIMGGSRHLDMLRVHSISEFLSLESLYFPLHEEVGKEVAASGNGVVDETYVVAVIFKSSVWIDLVKNLLRLSMPSGNEEYLMKVLKNLRRLYVP